MNIFITGTTGLLGREFLAKLVKNDHNNVYSLVRNAKVSDSNNLHYVVGDIKKPYFGLRNDENVIDLPKIDKFYHLAASVNLSDDSDDVWDTNYNGTYNALSLCHEIKAPKFYLCSSAYTFGRNTYEISKREGEKFTDIFHKVHGIRCTVFKPSIILPSIDNIKDTPGAFFRVISLMCRVHRRLEIIRRKIEGTLVLPIIEPMFRVDGNCDGYLNLIPVSAVVDAMMRINDGDDEYSDNSPIYHWLTSTHKYRLGDIGDLIGELLMLKLKFIPTEFKHTPTEILFEKMAKAFIPYLHGDDLWMRKTSVSENEDVRMSDSVLKELVIKALM